MRRFRFHIGTLVIFVLALGVGFAALRESNEIWDSSVFTLTIGVLLTSVLMAIHLAKKRRAFWLGFALFGAAYLVLSLVPPIESRLITTRALAYLDSKMPRSRADALYDLLVVSDNGQPNTVYLNKGNGTFQDVTTTVGLDYASDTLFLNTPMGFWLRGTGGTTEHFVHIGHVLITLIVASLGGVLSRRLYDKNRLAIQTSTSVGPGG
jgi:hypothetical protein